ncbi:unnamed protein product, partial [Ectocarpus sp. 13 AM-2016]
LLLLLLLLLKSASPVSAAHHVTPHSHVQAVVVRGTVWQTCIHNILGIYTPVVPPAIRIHQYVQTKTEKHNGIKSDVARPQIAVDGGTNPLLRLFLFSVILRLPILSLTHVQQYD